MTAQGRFHEDVFGATQQAQIQGAMATASGRTANQALLTAAQASNVEGRSSAPDGLANLNFTSIGAPVCTGASPCGAGSWQAGLCGKRQAGLRQS